MSSVSKEIFVLVTIEIKLYCPEICYLSITYRTGSRTNLVGKTNRFLCYYRKIFNSYKIMKVLLVNLPWISTEEEYGIRAGSRWPHTRNKKAQVLKCNTFPFYLAYTTAVLVKNDIDARIKDCIAEEMGKEGFLGMLTEINQNML